MRLFLLLAFGLLLLGCASQQVQKSDSATAVASSSASVAAKGNMVVVDYTAKTLDGSVFDTSIEAVAKREKLAITSFKPVELTLGKGDLLSDVEDGIVGMRAGETKLINVPPEHAYGLYSVEKILRIPSAYFVNASQAVPKPGESVTVKGNKGKVLDQFSDQVIVDFNNPLAGKTLSFEITLKEIKGK